MMRARRRLMLSSRQLDNRGVGDRVKLLFNEVVEDWIVVHKGAPNWSTSTSIGGAKTYSGFDGGIVLMRDKLAAISSAAHFTGYTTTADPGMTINNAKSFLSAEIQEQLMPVTLPYRYDTTSTFTGSPIGLSEGHYMWTPSASEYGYTYTNYPDSTDGGVFDYFADAATADQRRVGLYNDEAQIYGTRSTNMYKNSTDGTFYYYYEVNASGGVYQDGRQFQSGTPAEYYRLCIVLPRTFVVPEYVVDDY